MAIFSNRATLSYNGTTTDSNIAYGELLEVLTATKTAVEGSYAPGDLVTYAISLRNTGATTLTGVTITDNLGAYTYNGALVYPLTLEAATNVRVIVNGAVQTPPTVNPGPPLTLTGINIPAGGDAVILYQARANAFANPGADGTITNTATATGAGINAPISASATLDATSEPSLSIAKSISPAQVTDNDRVTYTFLIQNTGSAPATVAENAVITDTFDPILTALTVNLDGTPWTQGTQYTYNQATGLFTTQPGQILVPAATYTQDPTTGAYAVTPGAVTLTVTGTI